MNEEKLLADGGGGWYDGGNGGQHGWLGDWKGVCEQHRFLLRMRIMTRINGSATVKTKIDGKKYARLLAESLPAVIETEAENDRLLAVAQQLIKKGPARTPEETKLLKLLSHLIQVFEERFYQPRAAAPHEVLRELMAANGLRQSDLLPLFGSKSVTAEVVNGKRGISETQARALAEFFHVPAQVFL